MTQSIKYVGPFFQVRSEGVTFTRQVPIEVPAEIVNRLIQSNDADNVLFELAVEAPVLVEVPDADL